MAKTTPRVGIPYPTLTDAPNVQTGFSNMLDVIDSNQWEITSTLAGFEGTTNGQVGFDTTREVMINRRAGFNRHLYRTETKIKNANTTRTSTTTPTIDPDLVFTGNSTASFYVVDVFLAVESDSTADFRFTFGASSGSATFRIGMWYPNNDAAITSAGGLSNCVMDLSTVHAIPCNSPTQVVIVMKGFVQITSGSCTFGVHWSQNSSSVTDTTLLANSYMKVMHT